MTTPTLRRWLALIALPGASAALAQNASPAAAPADPPVLLDPVTVTAQRTRQSAFDAPAAITAVTRETIENGGPQVNLSEALNRVPGISILNRQNYAQDLQLSIRGFGARSTFGIRGVRLIVDGIPATMPDGQGQASSIALSSVGRIEVLRGPLAQLYGNAAGGVVQIFTEDAADVPTVTTTAAAGPYHQFKIGAKLSTSTPDYGLVIDASHFRTGGYRDHSEAERSQLNARWNSDLSASTHASVVLNALDQPTSLDPLGLTRAQWQANPRQAVPLATQQDTRKSVRQQQLGSVVEHQFDEDTTLTGRVYLGERGLNNALSTPLSAQQSPTSSGGIVEFARTYLGAGATLAHRVRLDAERSLRLTAGVEADRMRENRQGYLNDGGDAGALKRDERNVVQDADAFVQAALDLTSQWLLIGGARSSHVRFSSDDHFITAGNPDDSGGVSYSATNPVIGLSWHPDAQLNVYANAGRGFETPTFTELAYRNNATGLNTDLKASRSRHAEVGAKWKITPQQRIETAVFDITTDDELVVDVNSGGRSTYKNAGRTSRRGIEFSHVGQWTESLRSTLSLTALRARFSDSFVSGSGSTAVTVPAGSRLPGTPERNLFAELAWAPVNAWGGFNAGVEVVHTGRLYVNDANDDAAPAATVVNLRAGWAQVASGWRVSELVRLENAGDKRYAGSVIVNDANQRYFEPALPRNWLLGVTARYAFQ